jgi:DNA-binding transcriptional MerR regulator
MAAVKTGWEDVGNNLVKHTATGQIVDQNHPIYAKSQAVGNVAGNPGPPAPGTPPPAGSVEAQGNNAQTYSSTPGAAPTKTTGNQGTQDVVRNSYLQQATQGTTVDRNDPNLKQQLDPYVAAQEREKRNYVSEQAERLSAKGLGDSGQMQQEQRLASENAANASGAFESQLVSRELQNKRAEIQNALSSLSGVLSADQQREMQTQLADLDATLKREGYSTQEGIAGQQNRTQMTLGQGALNVDMIKTLLQNQQFNNGQALNWSQFDWETSPMNPRNWS